MPNGAEHFDQPQQHRHHRNHRHHHHHHGTKWTVIKLIIWIIIAVLIVYGAVLLFTKEGNLQIIGGVMCGAGIVLVAFSKNLRKWFNKNI